MQTLNSVKNKVREADKLKAAIYIRLNFTGSWYVLRDNDGDIFIDTNTAYKFAQLNYLCYFQISTFEQACIGNGMRDNV